MVLAYHYLSCELYYHLCVPDTTFCQLLAAGRRVSPGLPVSFINEIECLHTTEILMTVASNTHIQKVLDQMLGGFLQELEFSLPNNQGLGSH